MDVASKRATALLFVSILILATLTPLLSFNSDSESGGSQTHTVVYHPGNAGEVNKDYNSNSAPDVEVTYYGSIVSTEYNPQMWFHGSVSDGGSSTLPENTGKWYEINKYEAGKTLVFTGWQYATSASGDSFQWSSISYYPGEVLSSAQIEAATSNTDGKIHIRATWATLANYQEIDGSSTSYGNFSTGSAYTNIVMLKDATKTVSKIGGNGFTLRGSGSSSTVDLTYELQCAVIMDNVKIKASSLRTHANMTSFENTFSANSHVFIIGSGVTTIASGSNSDIRYVYPTVFGGILSSSVTPDYTERVPYTTSGKTESEKMASFMIIHAGTFSNVVSGGYRTGYTGSGYLVMKDTLVLDSLVGGTGGLTNWSSSSGEIRGSSYMYLTAVTMPGDSYGESKIGRNLGFGLLESTIITGGSGYGKVTESTNVFVSGTSDVWDVQGSGRCGYSYVNTANLEISGNSIVRHAACGSITDGKKNTTQNVEYISIVAKDASKVGNIYGGGYDTWDSPDNPSMFKNGTISVSVEDHAVVGGVYGGGYRGDIGSASERIDGISISISGGTILGNVYGGGCGGVDKVLHNSNGSISSQSNSKNSTGKSRVYANSIEISISGTAEIRGDVYGGGQSAPVISSSGFYSPVDDVASVECDTVSITITGAEVSMYGDVYGGGMGVDTTAMKKPTIDVMMDTGEMFSYDWYSGSSSLTYRTTGYSGFAGVTATSVSISMTGLKGTDSPDGIGVGNVYGGGALGVLSNGTTSIVLDDAFIKGCVYGGGKGSDSDSGAGHVENTDGITIELKGETVLGSLGDVTGVVGGGDKATTESSKIAILMGKGVVIYGDVYGGGIGASGKASTHSNRTILLNGASINGNIYGGSSLGNDCKLSESPEFADRTCTILLVSGVVTQGVYGGGYNGKSYLNSTILVGTDAATYAMDMHLISEYNTVDGKSYRLLINDIYGGGNLDPTTIESDQTSTLGSLFDSPLLMGSAEIRISAKEAGSFPGYDAIADSDTVKDLVNKICINGDIFGSGNYSSVKGNTSLYIDGYLQYEKTSIRSIQRFNEVSMSDTHITISGSSDGSITEITTMVSLCNITDLSLNGGVTLELSAETSKISSYYSRVGTGYAMESECGPDGKGNTVKLIDGVYFAILGPNNTGMVDKAEADGKNDIPDGDKIGRIYGFTYLTRQTGEGYYGAFALSSDLTQDDSGFAVEDKDVIRKADVIAGDPKTSPIKTWYIAGYQELTERVTFSGSNTESITLRLPRTVAGSYYAYIGNYTDPEIQDGFYLLKDDGSVDKITDDTEKGKVFISASFENKVSVVSHTVDGNGRLTSIVDSDSKRGSDNRPVFTTKLLRNTSCQAGYIGTVTIHIAEYGSETSEIPINRINMVIQINIDPKIDDNNANMCISVPNTVSSGKNRGSGYIQLKSDKGTLVRYTLVSAEIENGDTISIWSDVLRNGSNGWTQRIYNEDNPLSVTNDTKGVYLGEGLGNKDSTLGFAYDGSKPSFELTISDSSGITYNITVNLVESADVKLNFAYRPIGEDSAMMYLNVAGSGTENNPFILKWADTGIAFQLPYGTVLGSQKFHFKFDDANKEMTIEAALQKMMDMDVSLGDTDGTSFNYGDNLYGWFINESCLTKYNMLSAMKEDLTLYAGYGIKITFNGNGAHASPTEFYIRPGETLSKYFLNVGEKNSGDDDRVQVLRETTLYGYEMNPNAWVYGSDAKEFGFETKVYAPIDLYINWVPKEYTLTFEFYTSSNATSKIDNLDVTYSPNVSADGLKAAYRTTIELTLNDTSYRFASSRTLEIEFRGFGTKNLEFEMPAVDELTGKDSLTVRIVVQEGYTLTVQPSGLGHTPEKFNRYGIQLTHDDGRPEQEMLDLTNGIGTTFVSSSHDHSLTIVPNENFGKDWCWAFWYLENGEWIYYDTAGRGQVSLELKGASGDLVIGYSLYKVVKLNLGNTVDHVKRTWNGVQTEDTLKNGSDVCEGDILEPVPKTGYSCPPKVTVGVICKEDGKYTVTGNEDVTFAEMTPNSVTVVVNFDLDPKYGHSGFNVTLILGLLSNEAEMEVPVSINATNSEKSYTKEVAAEGEVLGEDEITARIAGFELTAKTYDGTESTLTLRFKLIEYTVHYKPIHGNVWDNVADTMNVIDGGFQLRSDGTADATVAGNVHPVWLSLGNINDGQIVGFVWILSPESFGDGMYDDNYSHLYLVGLEPFTGSSEKEMTIVAEQSALKNGVDVTEEFRNDNPCDVPTVTTPEGITVSYSDGKLTVKDPGTGQFTVTIGGYKVTIVSIGTVQASG